MEAGWSDSKTRPGRPRGWRHGVDEATTAAPHELSEGLWRRRRGFRGGGARGGPTGSHGRVAKLLNDDSLDTPITGSLSTHEEEEQEGKEGDGSHDRDEDQLELAPVRYHLRRGK